MARHPDSLVIRFGIKKIAIVGTTMVEAYMSADIHSTGIMSLKYSAMLTAGQPTISKEIRLSITSWVSVALGQKIR